VTMMLTFEKTDEGEVIEIHGNQKGLLWLSEQISGIAMAEVSDHIHLLTEDWGGSLSTEVQCEENQLVRHVKIFCWVESKATK
jgi:hypothetical protein